MSGNNEGQIDLETLSDEEFLKLTPDQIENMTPSSEEEEEGAASAEVTTGEEQPSSQEEGASEEEGKTEETPNAEEEVVTDEAANQEELETVTEEAKTSAADGKSTDKPFTEKKPGSEDKAKSEQKIEKKAKEEVTKAASEAEINAAQEFMKKITAPFKADGKDFTVKSPEDAIRLMQQGVNYSRRMQELKPVRALNHMLTQNGLNDPDKLSYLIDIHNGKPEAIQKLLKEKGIDPLDIDTSKESDYQVTDHRGNPKDIAFKEAIETTMQAPGGRELLTDVNASWDDNSKEALRESPVIFENLLEHKSSGVYDIITKELNYQQTLGYLKDVPFLQAYHQVGEALNKAGVFNSEQESPNSQTDKPELAPLDTGPRKATLKTKSEKPNQDISSLSQPKAAPSSDGKSADETDYSTLSDEEFMKLNVPG